MTHLNEQQINACVQYEAGNNAFFKLSDHDYETYTLHIEACISCSKRFETSKKHYDAISETEAPRKPYGYIAAAVVFLALLFPWNSSELNKDAFIDYKAFGFTIHRGESTTPTDSMKAEWTYLLNENHLETVITACETEGFTENNLHYIAALVLKGQASESKTLILKAQANITHDSLSYWNTKIKLITGEVDE